MLKNPDIQGMLSAPDKRIREATGLLSRLYRLTLFELSLTPYKWGFLLDKRLDKFASGENFTHDMISNERSNLRKGLNEPDMTYPMFCRGIEILDAVSSTFYVKMRWGEGETLVTIDKEVTVDKPRDKPELGDLSYVFRGLLEALGKDVENLGPEIDKYLSNPLMRSEIKGKKRGNDKGNLRRELKVDDITWHVFRKGLLVLQPEVTELGVKLRWNAKKVTTHRLEIRAPRT